MCYKAYTLPISEYTILPAVTMSQTETQAEPDTKKAEESSESTNQESEPKTEETSQSNDAEQPKETEKTEEVTENKDVETKDEEKKEEKDEEKKTDDNTDGSKKEEAVVAAAGKSRLFVVVSVPITMFPSASIVATPTLHVL